MLYGYEEFILSANLVQTEIRVRKRTQFLSLQGIMLWTNKEEVEPRNPAGDARYSRYLARKLMIFIVSLGLSLAETNLCDDPELIPRNCWTQLHRLNQSYMLVRIVGFPTRALPGSCYCGQEIPCGEVLKSILHDQARTQIHVRGNIELGSTVQMTMLSKTATSEAIQGRGEGDMQRTTRYPVAQK